MSDVVIIGAGPGGVSAAVCLHDLGIRPLLIDRADHVAASWRGRYDRLKLNTGRQFSHLPNRPYPKGTPTFPTRDQVVAYLDHHAREDGIALRLGTSVKRIDRSSRGWRLTTSAGDIDARQVVVATGYENSPVVPDWQGKDRFTGELMHSSAYRNPGPFVDKQVLVVGAGSSAMEIAHDLATGGAAKVWLAVRTPPNIILRTLPGGLPGDLMATPLYHFPVRFADAIARAARRAAIGDLTSFGLPVPNEGIFSRSARLGRAPAILDIEVIDAIKNSAIEVVAAVSALGGGSVTFPTAPCWIPTSSLLQQATNEGWNSWSATSAFSTTAATRVPLLQCLRRRVYSSSAFSPGLRSSATWASSPSEWRSRSPESCQLARYSDSSTRSGISV